MPARNCERVDRQINRLHAQPSPRETEVQIHLATAIFRWLVAASVALGFDAEQVFSWVTSPVT